MRFSASNVITVVVALAIGVAIGWAQVSEPITFTTVKEIPSAEMLQRIRDLEIERNGLQALLNAVDELPTRTVYVTDTLVPPPDTVIQTVRIEPGEIRYATFTRIDSLYAPEIRVVPFDNCDDGLSITGTRVVCDKARFGHLFAFGELQARYTYLNSEVRLRPVMGLWWTPSYRSSWQGFISTDGSTVEAGFRKGWQIF